MAEKNPIISDSLQASFNKLDHLKDTSPLLKSIEKLNNSKPLPQIQMPQMDNLIDPTFNAASYYKPPEIEGPTLGDEIGQICEFNKQLVTANKELVGNLEKESKQISDLQSAIKENEKSHRHDTLKQILITILGCVLSFLLGHFLP